MGALAEEHWERSRWDRRGWSSTHQGRAPTNPNLMSLHGAVDNPSCLALGGHVHVAKPLCHRQSGAKKGIFVHTRFKTAIKPVVDYSP